MKVVERATALICVNSRPGCVWQAWLRQTRIARLLPETSEEHRGVGDLADALWHDLVRRATSTDQS